MQTNTPAAGRGRKVGVIVLAVIVLLLLILGGIYAGIAMRFQRRFLPGTEINGTDVAEMTVEQAESALTADAKGYSLTLHERGGATETITAAQIQFSISFNGALEKLLEEQSPWAWPLARWAGKTVQGTVETVLSYDENSFNQTVGALNCMNKAASTAPRDAYLSGYDEQTHSVQVVPEVQGNLVKQEVLLPAIKESILSMKDQIDLEQLGCYEAPKVTADDPELQRKAQALNQYLGVTITYQFGDDTVEVGGKELANWLSLDENDKVKLDGDKVAAFVRNLARTYNTCFSNRTFQTSYGQEIEVEGGDYGWWMDEETEIQELTQQIMDHKSGERKPVWRQEASAFGNPDKDFGDTYVEVNLTAQHLYYYKDGELLLESDFVSGKNDHTPTGTYGVLYCERYATLKGENYASPVSYWMPFYGGAGLHDASWRTEFGGTLYKSGGSHGCINMPIDKAKKMYENMKPGTAVIIYKLSGTEHNQTSSQSYEQIADAVVSAVNEIDEGGTISSQNYEIMSKRIKWAKAAYDKLSESAKSLVNNYGRLKKAVNELKNYENANGISSDD